MDLYRVYGNPIAQSKSPLIHKMFADQTKQNIHYDKELVPLTGFVDAVRSFIALGGKGANVTAPFKEQALAMCDQLSSRAKLAGAVNTLSFRDGKIIGDNTDGLGLVNDLLRHHVVIRDAKVLLLGAGGAAKGVVLPILEQKPNLITIANRTVSKAQNIIEQFNHTTLRAQGFNEIEDQTFDIIINATSAGLTNATLPISGDVIKRAKTCYDMVYGRELPPFLKQAQSLNVENIIDGLGMLVGQAAESFYQWRQVNPEVTSVLKTLRAELNQD